MPPDMRRHADGATPCLITPRRHADVVAAMRQRALRHASYVLMLLILMPP